MAETGECREGEMERIIKIKSTYAHKIGWNILQSEISQNNCEMGHENQRKVRQERSERGR